MTIDIERFNADWLAAWSRKDVARVLACYAPDCIYKDPQRPDGVTGHDALRTYLTALFGSTPPMRYTPDATWRIQGGFCSRWRCEMGESGALGALRGFDLVLLKGDRIGVNEVYIHQMPGRA